MNSKRWTQIEDIYHRVVERPVDERLSLLKTLCGDNVELKREVESLLRYQPSAEQFMDKPFDVAALLSEKTALIGQQVGPYRIGVLLGEGGMGIVFRAHDTRLERDVALKFLPNRFTSELQRARFEREAKILARLNHPHICTLHDVGQYEGSAFLVLELVEGETLTDRLKRGALQLEQALKYAIQIADALDKAHRQGVVHRDLKPGNIMLTNNGVKLLDFGLAKLRHPDGRSAASTPTEVTAQGTIAGTLHYMSPEQLEGKEADARSDIFAFGAVLCEMLSGRKAFGGKTQAEIIASIMRESADLPLDKGALPPDVARIITACLEKVPDDRFNSARDLMRNLQWAADRGLTPVQKGSVRQIGRVLPVAAGLLVIAVIVWLGTIYFARSDLAPSSIRFTFLVPASTSSHRVSPDGRLIAMISLGTANQPLIYIRPLESSDLKPLPGTEGVTGFFWSPDSRYIAFGSLGNLRKIAVNGGAVETLTPMIGLKGGLGAMGSAFHGALGGSWNHENTIIFAQFNVPNPVVYKIPASGGTPTPLTTLDHAQGEIFHTFPEFLPDGRHFSYFAKVNAPGKSRICLADLDMPECKVLMNSDYRAIFAPEGYFLFPRETTMMAQRFDQRSLRLMGEPSLLFDGISRGDPYLGDLGFSIGRGLLTFTTAPVVIETRLAWLDRNGREIESTIEPGLYSQPSLSPDGRRIAFQRADRSAVNPDIWILDLSKHTTKHLTSDPAMDLRPVWSHDGSKIAFTSNRGSGVFSLYQMSANGLGAEELLFETQLMQRPEDFSNDGRYLIYMTNDPQTSLDIWARSLREGVSFPVVNTPFSEANARLSPDGRWLAYISDESARLEVYVQPFLKHGERVPISNTGGYQPRWSKDGGELYYIAPDNYLMSTSIQTQSGEFKSGTPVRLFQTKFNLTELNNSRSNYEVSTGSKRFLFVNSMEQERGKPITVISNWTALLNR